MNILLISDLHSSAQALKQIDGLLEQEHFDLVCCTGDITDSHDEHGVGYLENFIELVTTKYKTELKIVFGNNDSSAVIAYAKIRKVLLHFSCVMAGGQKVCGIGDFESHPETVQTNMPDFSGSILMTHRPPLKKIAQVDELSSLKGSPRFHLAGHLHTRAETWQLGQATVVQIPAALDGRYATLELPSNKVTFKWFKK